MRKALESLIFPKSKDDFFESYESNTPFVIHELKDSIRDLTDLPLLKSLEHLISIWPQKVDVYSPKISDEASAVPIPADEALKLFEDGRGLLFNDANDISPALTQWLGDLRQDLGLPAMTYGRNLIYATKAGKGTAPHFDQNMNFVIQVHGTKKWWLAPNQNVENPLTRHLMGQPMDEELAGYARSPMPTKMPDDAIEITLKPGSMLFVPRGSWHRTEAVTDAMALNFTFSAPTWIDIFTAALKSRLSLSPEWRETAHPEAIEKLNMLLTELSYDAQEWRAEDILEATESSLYKD